jgi:hypothetical protein
VVKCIKRLPVRFTQLPEPKSSLLERLVLQLQQQNFGDRHLKGIDGFEVLLAVVLEAVAGTAAAAVDAQTLEGAKVNSSEWRAAAEVVLDKRMDGLGWLMV